MTNSFGLSQEALDTCAREPIHIPGSIQPQGVLLVLTHTDLTITQVSLNSADIIGCEPGQLLGQPLTTLLPSDVVTRVQQHLVRAAAGSIAAFEITLLVRNIRVLFLALGHQHQGLALLELLPLHQELVSGADAVLLPADPLITSPTAALQTMTGTMRNLAALTLRQDSSTPLPIFCQSVVEQVRAITGYDRVMIYQFDDDGNGEVIAEARVDSVEPFLGLCYPAADIPPQARLLYLRSRVRALGDIYASPIPLIPRLNPVTGQDVDLSYCLLRSFSPVHLEYLHNMGVRATLTVSIIEQGRLWGLIACHHYQPKWPNQAMRDASDVLSEIISMQIVLRAHALRMGALTQAKQAQHNIVRRIVSRGDWMAALLEPELDLVEMLKADGAAVCRGSQIVTLGIAPEPNTVRALVTWLQTTVPAQVFITDSLPTRNPSFTLSAPLASGLIAMEIGRTEGNYILWFRREAVQTITWGGNPAEKLSVSDGSAWLRPRTSFAAWTTEMRGRARPWPAASQALVEMLRSLLVEVVLELVTTREMLTNLDLLRIRRAVEASSEPIVITKADGDVLFINPAFTSLTGYTLVTLRDAGGLAALPNQPQQAARIEAAARSVAGLWRGDVDLRTLDGIIVPVHLQVDLVRSDLGTPIGQIRLYTDLRPRLLAAEERRRLDAQLLQAQKLESLGVLAGGVAHDFNNLLTAMLGHANLALLDLPNDSPARTSIAQIELAAQRAAELSKQMLAYSGRGHFVVEAVDLNVIITEMATLLQTATGKHVMLQLDLATTLPAINADATQIRQVVMNLITNASDAIGERAGMIRVTTRVVNLDAARLAALITFDALPTGEYVTLEMTDTGSGMDTATLARIFEPFFTTKFAGRGLGLAAVQGILRGHRAALQVTSAVGHGTTFQIYFPALVLGSSRPAPQASDVVLPFGNDRVVLVVDDDASVRTFAQRVLERSGFRVLLAEDGQVAMEQFPNVHTALCAVVLDLTMPRMGGLETFTALQQIDPNVPVILCSGYNEPEAMANFAGSGLAGFVQKPFRSRDLLDVLEHVVRG